MRQAEIPSSVGGEKGTPMSNSVSETSLSADIFRYIRYQLRGRRGLIVGIAALAVAGLWFSWPWLVLAGIAPILIAVAPCAIMCALGLCGRHLVSNAHQGEVDSNSSRSAASCCSQSSSVEETDVSSPAKQLTYAPAEPIEIAVASEEERNAADAESQSWAEEDPRPEETITQRKETM